MNMTNEEIIRNYKESKYPYKQSRILAQLNGCSEEDIKNVLREAGVLKSYSRKPAKAEKKKQEVNVTVKETKEVIPTPETNKPEIPAEVARLIDNRLKEINIQISQYQHEISLLRVEQGKLTDYREGSANR